MDPQSLPFLTGSSLVSNLFATDRAAEPDAGPEIAPAPPTITRGAVIVTDALGDAERLHDDLAFAAEIGLTQVRLDVPWRLAQPKEGRTDGGVMEALHAAALAASALGLQPWFRLLQPDVPHWFDDEGGFTDDRIAGLWWPRWVEAVAEHLGEVAAGWVPFEAPFAMANRIVPNDPRKHGETTHNLVIAWRDAWRILRGGPPVATSLDVATERPTGPAQSDIDEARRRDQLRWGLWLDGLSHGNVRIPGRYDREVPDLAGACDILGLAVRGDVAGMLDRAAEQGPERPMAITFRPTGDNDTSRADSITTMWRDVRTAARSVTITAVTITPLFDATGRLGIATPERRLKDAGEAFLAG
ncbi:MAG: family 1 glycosylhydrolase [Actinomycetota bacterium]